MIVRWMCSVRAEGRISAEELMTRLKSNNMREWLQDKRLQWFGYLEGMEESAWSSVNVEPSRSVVVTSKDNHGKHGMRLPQAILKKGKLSKTERMTEILGSLS